MDFGHYSSLWWFIIPKHTQPENLKCGQLLRFSRVTSFVDTFGRKHNGEFRALVANIFPTNMMKVTVTCSFTNLVVLKGEVQVNMVLYSIVTFNGFLCGLPLSNFQHRTNFVVPYNCSLNYNFCG